MYSTADKHWDRLCDSLGGRGVPSLDDALVQLELRPVHDALRAALDPAVVRMFADAVETLPVPGATPEKRNGKKQSEILDTAWGRCEELLAAVLPAWARLSGERAGARPVRPESLAPIYRKCLRNAMRLLAVEALIPAPWSAAARRVLPNSSPDVPATALWGPVMSWCLLQTLALAIDEDHVERTALDLFDRLRLREPLAQAFQALGMEGERGWRAAARLKILLMIEAGVGAEAQPQPKAATPAASKLDVAAQALVSEAVSASPAPAPTEAKPGDADGVTGAKSVIPAALWKDPDVRWLTGFNEADGHTYVIREPYEELLWWLSLPSLLKLANMSCPHPQRCFCDRRQNQGSPGSRRKGRLPHRYVAPARGGRTGDACPARRRRGEAGGRWG